MVFKYLCTLVLQTKVALALDGLSMHAKPSFKGASEWLEIIIVNWELSAKAQNISRRNIAVCVE